MDHVEYLTRPGSDQSICRSRTSILKATKTFYPVDTEPCIKTNFEMRDWYHGTGLPPLEHPGMGYLRVLARDLPKTLCGYCKSKNVLVITLQGCVHPMSGDAYYDYEVVCEDCGGFTAFAYAEN